MKLAEKVGKVYTSDNVTSRGFQIATSRKAFEILSSGLYTDKILAIVRELSTNAADAHIAAGKKDIPFTVHLPTQFEPEFYIEDYGTGLSEDAVMNLYTTYFASDKTNSDDFTGCLGLGSKSPFSYTDTFTVESRYNGMKTIYTAFIADGGYPEITKLNEVPTTEQNGITVKFPVKDADCRAFRDRAEKVYKWFAVRPNVIGNEINIEGEREYLRKTEKYGVHQSHTGESVVIMGNVAYPVRAHEFLIGYDENTQRLQSLLNWGVEFYVKIGDVEMAASRENLQYTKGTIAFMTDRLNEILADLEAELTKEIATQPTLWEARKKLKSIRSSFQGFKLKAEYAGKLLEDHVKLRDQNEKMVVQAQRFRTRNSNSTSISLKKDTASTIQANDTVFLNDGPGAYAAIRRWFQAKQEAGNLRYNDEAILISSYTEEWLKETGVCEIGVKTSSLPKPPRAAWGSVRGSATKAKMYEFVPAGNVKGGSAAASYWQAVDIDVNETDGVFVEILYFSYRNEPGEATDFPSRLARPLELIKGLTGKDIKLYGIRPSDRDMLKEAEGEWTTLRGHMKELLVEADKEYQEDFIKKSQYDGMYDSYYSEAFRYKPFAELNLKDDNLFTQYVNLATEWSKAGENEKLDTYSNFRSYCGQYDLPKTDNPLMELHKKLIATYPLLQYLKTGEASNDSVLEYVRLKDSQSQVSLAVVA